MKRSMDIGWAQLRVGVFLATALVLFGFGLFLIGQKTRLFVPTVEVRVVLADVQGLRIGAPVWLSGVVIGAVEDIVFASPLRSDEVVVVLQLEKSAARRLGSDAEVAIRGKGLLGEKYVDIIPGGSPGVPGEPLRGAEPMGMDQVLARAYGAFERFDRILAHLESGEGSFARLLRDPELHDAVVDVIRRSDSVLRAVDEGEGTLGGLARDPRLYRRLVSLGARGEGALGRFERLLAELETADGTFGRLVRDPQLYERSLEAVEQFRLASAEIDGLLRTIRQGQGTLGKLVTESELHDRLVDTLDGLDVLLRDVRKNPSRYVRFSLF